MPCAGSAREESHLDKLHGVYNFEHPGGNFEVHLRAGGRFFAPRFPEKSVWKCDNTCCENGTCHLLIEWGRYGQYVLDCDMATLPPCCSGSAKGDPENWRKMTMKRPFTLQETMIMDSEWEFEHPGGSFAIEFRADGLNSFVCEDFPVKKATWRLEESESETPTVYINWGRYGEYELKMAHDGESMTGSAKGNAVEWRSAVRLRSLSEMKQKSKRRERESCHGCKAGCMECD